MSNSRSDCMLLEVGLDIPSTVRGSALPPSPFPSGHAGASIMGRRCNVNDDAWAALPDLGVFVVAGGRGGRSGRMAANLALSCIERALSADPAGGVEPLAVALEEANARICSAQLQRGAQPGMIASVVALRIAPPWVVTVSVGDCRIHRFRQGVDPSSLRGADIRGEPDRGIPTQPLGATLGEVDFEVRYTSARSGDLFLLCSHGVTAQLSAEAVRAVLSAEEVSLEARCKRLLQAVDERGGNDNATAVLVRT
jgi:serine/threonine protein phosphatase PrpC